MSRTGKRYVPSFVYTGHEYQCFLKDWSVILTPTEYESLVAAYYAGLGYNTRQTAVSGDYGVDVFAENGQERVTIQAKLYGNTSRRVNRKMVMELHGAAAYFDCDRAVMATDGGLLPDAIDVARKLDIEILSLPAITPLCSHPEVLSQRQAIETSTDSSVFDPGPPGSSQLSFDRIWQDYVMPLEGQTIDGQGDRSNVIERVDWAGVVRISSTGKRGRIDIEIFRLAINHILRHGQITRDHINQNYAKRASSGVVLILSQVPIFEVKQRPLTLRIK